MTCCCFEIINLLHCLFPSFWKQANCNVLVEKNNIGYNCQGFFFSLSSGPAWFSSEVRQWSAVEAIVGARNTLCVGYYDAMRSSGTVSYWVTTLRYGECCSVSCCLLSNVFLLFAVECLLFFFLFFHSAKHIIVGPLFKKNMHSSCTLHSFTPYIKRE